MKIHLSRVQRLIGAGVLAATLGSSGAAFTADSAEAATGSVGYHTVGTVNCNPSLRYGIPVPAPKMRAVNTTTATDRQTVAFRPVLWSWNGTSWVQFSAGMWLYATATDTASPTTWYDLATGRSMGSGGQSMMATGSSRFWRVSYDFYWYPTTRVQAGSDSLWATHTSPIGGVISYCTY